MTGPLAQAYVDCFMHVYILISCGPVLPVRNQSRVKASSDVNNFAMGRREEVEAQHRGNWKEDSVAVKAGETDTWKSTLLRLRKLCEMHGKRQMIHLSRSVWLDLWWAGGKQQQTWGEGHPKSVILHCPCHLLQMQAFRSPHDWAAPEGLAQDFV